MKFSAETSVPLGNRAVRFAAEAVARHQAGLGWSPPGYATQAHQGQNWYRSAHWTTQSGPRNKIVGLSDFASDSAAFRQVNEGARSAYLAGDLAGANNLFASAQSIAAAYPGTFDDDLAYTQAILAGDQGAAADQAAIQQKLVAAIQNQPGLWDQLLGSSPNLPLAAICSPCGLIWPGATVGQAVTVVGGYFSAAGLATPQSGADFQAKTKAQATLGSLCAKVLPAWVCANPGKSALIALAAVGAAAGAVVYAASYAHGRGLRRSNPVRHTIASHARRAASASQVALAVRDAHRKVREARVKKVKL